MKTKNNPNEFITSYLNRNEQNPDSVQNAGVSTENQTKFIIKEKQTLKKQIVSKAAAATGGGVFIAGLGIIYALRTKRLDKLIDFIDKKQYKLAYKLNLKASKNKNINFLDKVQKNTLSTARKTIKSLIDTSTDISKKRENKVADFLESKLIKAPAKFFNGIADNTIKIKYQKLKNQPDAIKTAAKGFFDSLRNKGGEISLFNEKGKLIKIKFSDLGIDQEQLNKIINEQSVNIEKNIDTLSKHNEALINGLDNRIKDLDQGIKNLIKDNKSGKETDALHHKLKQALFGQKRVMSRSFYNNEDRMRELLNRAEKLIKSENIDINLKGKKLNKQIDEKFERISINLKKYAIGEQSEGKPRAEYLNEFVKSLDELVIIIDKNNIKTDGVKKAVKYLKEAAAWCDNAPKGTVQDIRNNLKIQLSDVVDEDVLKKYGLKSDQNLLKAMDYTNHNKLKNLINTYDRKLKNTVSFETDNYFKRKRDIKQGAATLELASLVATIPILGASVAKGESKQEKNSALLKNGLPTIAGLGTWSLAGITKLLPMRQALGIGLISGLLLSRTAKNLDEKINKDYYEEVNNKKIYTS